MQSDTEVLSDFFRSIWREAKGHVYLALKTPGNNEWQQRFFEWPVDESLVTQFVINERTSHEVYFAPAIFREPSALKANVLGSFCFWLEFDGSLPVDFGEVPAPSMIVQTSTETHQHIYWATDTFIDSVEKIETVNRSLAYQLGADVSGWDANQVLRPPQTLNHKKKLQAKIVAKNDKVVSSVAFSDKLVINLPPKIEVEGPLPQLPEVVRKYTFSRETWDLFAKGVRWDRSAGLMKLGYCLAEMNLTNHEMMALLLDADKRWGKFTGRNDQVKRLSEIITIAKLKHPFKTNTSPEATIVSIGDTSLLATELKVDWLWEGVLHQSGYLLLTGHTGVGKSQFSLDFAAHLVLGEDFLGRKVHTSKKVAFISLEMGLVELKLMREMQVQRYNEEQRMVLEKNMRHVPVGFPIYFNRDENQKMIQEFIEREGIECVIFDSLGSMTEQELSQERDAKGLMDWNDHLRAELGISTIIIHHHRKAQTGNKRPNSISDIYGSHYFTARATTVMTLWDPKFTGLIEVSYQKMRLSKREKPHAIKRQDDLCFELSSDKVEFIVDDTEIDITEPTAPEIKDAFDI